MVTEKQIERYVKQFGDKLINDVVNKIEQNDWIASGNLLNSLEFTTQTFKGKIIGELNIAGYYQFLKDGAQKTRETETRKLTVKTSPVTAQAYAQRIQVDENKVTFVTPLLAADIKFFDEKLVPQIEKDVVKIIEDNLKKVTK
jgi:hypothetical protein